MKMAQYNLKPHRKGDTFDSVEFKLSTSNESGKTPIDLTNCSIVMDIRNSLGIRVKRLTSLSSGGITILDPPTNGIFKIDSQIIDIPTSKYVYDIQITFPDNTVRTYIWGYWVIYQDVTYEEVGS